VAPDRPGSDTRTRLEPTPDGRRLVVSRAIEVPADRAFETLRDTETWPDWGPSVRAVDCPTRFVEAGTRGRVRVAAAGVWVPFEVTSCRDYRWTWRVARVPATGHVVEPLAAGRCRVGFEVPPLAAPYVAVCKVALERIEHLLL
jgi:hypothetical protein